jgi:hypothetical protein
MEAARSMSSKVMVVKCIVVFMLREILLKLVINCCWKREIFREWVDFLFCFFVF